MTVERKIREFLNRDVSLTEAFPGAGTNKEETPAMQGSSQKPEVQQMHTGMGGKTPAVSQKLAAGAGPKEGSAMKQGSSQDAVIDSTDNQDTQGKTQSAKAKKQPVPMTKGAGNAPNYKTVSDPSSVINQSSSAGNVYKEEVDEDMNDDEYITEDEFNALSDEEQNEYEVLDLDDELEEDIDDLDMDLLSEIIAEISEEYNLTEEQINELSKKTLKSYSKKAATSASRNWIKGEKEEDKSMSTNGEKYPEKQERHMKNAGKAYDIASKREKGIKTAAAKLKESEDMDLSEEQIDELSSAAYSQYIKRSRADISAHAKGGIKTLNDAEKIGKRAKGIKNAKRQLANEELEADIVALFGSDATLSEEFKEKAASLFEAVVTARINNIYEELEKEALAVANTYVETYTEELVDQLDSYLTYIAEHWLEENAVAVETGLRNEISEDFMNGLKTLFQEHYIDVPEEKYDLVGELQAQVESLTNSMNEVISENINLNSELIESYKEIIINNSSNDLAQTEVEKLRGLAESVEFDSPEMFEEKINVIKNSYFPKTKNSPMLHEEVEPNEEQPSTSIAKYAELLSRGTFTK